MWRHENKAKENTRQDGKQERITKEEREKRKVQLNDQEPNGSKKRSFELNRTHSQRSAP